MVLPRHSRTSSLPAAHNDPVAKMQRRTGRVIRAKGTAQTAKDFGLKDFLDIRILDKKWKDKIRLWFPSNKASFDEGKPFVFRLLPALSFSTRDDEPAQFVSGRDPYTGELSMEMIRAVGIVEKFGSSDHQVMFMPQEAYQPDDGYAPYTGPDDNPLALLRAGLRSAARVNALPPKWLPLVFGKKKVEEELEKAGINAKYGRPLLPFAQTKYLCYVWVYAGAERTKGEYIQSPDEPIGSLPEHGLQIAILPDQVFSALGYLYQLKEKKNARVTNAFAYPDPANENEGCLNYAWNRAKRSPIDGSVLKGDGFGYTAAADAQYYEKPNKPQDVDLTLPQDFGDWYYENWQLWDDILTPVTGVEQVALLAEYFPELGPVCMQIWDGHDELLAAAEKAPFSKKDTDFFELLYSLNQPRKEATGSRGVKVSDSGEYDEEDYEPSGRVTRSSGGTKQRRMDVDEEEEPRRTSRSEKRRIDEEEEETRRPARSETRRRPRQEEEDDVDVDAEVENEEPVTKRRSRQEAEPATVKPKRTLVDEEDDVDVDEPDEQPARKVDVRRAAADKLRSQRTAPPKSTRTTVVDANDYDEEDYEDEETEN